MWATLRRVLAGYAVGTVSGYLLGLLMGSLPLVRAALEPLLDALYVVPKLALLPVFLNMFGLGEGPQVALVAATVFFFVWISTMAAVLAIPSGHRDAGQVFGASAWQMFRHVLLPASCPPSWWAPGSPRAWPSSSSSPPSRSPPPTASAI